jgi:S1-C subfamily serine protease
VTTSPIPVVVHLSGLRRGTTQRLRGDILRIGEDPDSEIRVSPEPCVADRHATLHRRLDSYELLVEPGEEVWINGELAQEALLASGDLLEIGRDGPILRFRLYPPGSDAAKTFSQAFSDCVDCARYSADSKLDRAALFLAGAPKEMATQTSVAFRAAMVVLLFALVAATAYLAFRSHRLEHRLSEEVLKVEGISQLLEEDDNRDLELEDLEAVRLDITTALERVRALEERTQAPTRVVAAASQSIVLLQGAYGFVDPISGQPLRFAGVGKDGLPLRSPEGSPLVALGGDGPILESFFTGTAFVATENGLLLTNRHVVLPWEYDEAAKIVIAQGLAPVMRKLQGYLPGLPEAFQVTLVLASDTSDLAVLECSDITGTVAALPLADRPPDSGDEVIVLGYPTGIRALLARADEAFMVELSKNQELDFWAVAALLASKGHIAPLASRGIVAQVGPAAVVYDAETTRGGSGGPVLDLEGNVIAVTTAVVPEFGGSNLGVPSARARALVYRAVLSRRLPIALR